MQKAFGFTIPQTLDEACDPITTALLVYDMQVGIFQQADKLHSVVPKVNAIIEAARAANMRIFFSRHMSVPNRFTGPAQLRTAAAWQRKQEVTDVQEYFLRDSEPFSLIPEIKPRSDEVIFDKMGMSFFHDTPLDTVLRNCGINSFIIVGVVLEIGIAPTVTHGVDLGYIPIIVTDACGSVETQARQRTLADIAYMQTSFTTDSSAICRLLARHI